jgi:hypothetical protein
VPVPRGGRGGYSASRGGVGATTKSTQESSDWTAQEDPSSADTTEEVAQLKIKYSNQLKSLNTLVTELDKDIKAQNRKAILAGQKYLEKLRAGDLHALLRDNAQARLLDFFSKQSVTRLPIFCGLVRKTDAIDLRQFNSGLELVRTSHFSVESGLRP